MSGEDKPEEDEKPKTSTMVAEYRTKLIDKEVLKKKLDQLFAEAEENMDSDTESSVD